MCGWYVWTGGEIPEEDPNFFEVIHAEHMHEERPELLPYLWLPAGWRVLLGEKSFVDVWFDEALLQV